MKRFYSGRGLSDDEVTGFACIVGAYLLWGFLPLYFSLISAVPTDQIVAQRIVWSVIFVGAFMAARHRLAEVAAIARDPAKLVRLTLSAVILAVNWFVFVFAIETGRVLEISFGYFILPLVSVALGTLLLRETLSAMQRIAVAIAVVAIVIQAWSLGGLPWISLALAFSFGGYGFLRKTVSAGAAPGFLVEALALGPLALAYLGWLAAKGALVFTLSPMLALLVAGTGVATAVPLILFAVSVRRLTLTTVGIMQYIAPSIQFLLAVALFGEPLDMVRLLSFTLIWISVAIFARNAFIRRAVPL